MEEQEDGWLTVLEKNRLGPAAVILENYGIDCETDLLVLDQDDFSKLASRGLKPFHVKKKKKMVVSAKSLPRGNLGRNFAEHVSLDQPHRDHGTESALLPGPGHVILLPQLR